MQDKFPIITLIITALIALTTLTTAQQVHENYLFRVNIEISNATYIYYTNVATLTVTHHEKLSLTNIECNGNVINNMWIYIEEGDGQYVAIIHAISNGKPNISNEAIILNPGKYSISILIQPNEVHLGESEIITLYFMEQK